LTRATGRRIDALVLTYLVNALWLTPAALAAGMLGARLLHRAPARQRHVLWLAVAAACVGESVPPPPPPIWMKRAS
jgi:hypothetical protein